MQTNMLKDHLLRIYQKNILFDSMLPVQSISMKKLLLFMLLAGSITSCSTARQGAEGRITEVTGNRMPGPGVKHSPAVPVQTEVLFTIALAMDEVKRNEQGLYETPPEKLIVKRISTDKNGYFKTSLQPGVYSVFVKTSEGWFANITDENGVLNKVTVERKQYVTADILVNNKAFY